MTLSERVLIILATLAATVSVASAQNSVTEYQKAAGWDMPLYRGKQMTEYSYRFKTVLIFGTTTASAEAVSATEARFTTMSS